MTISRNTRAFRLRSNAFSIAEQQKYMFANRPRRGGPDLSCFLPQITLQGGSVL
jgi:hypothetical protein